MIFAAILFTLFLDVLRYHIFIGILTYRCDKIAVGPEFSTPKLLLHFGMLGKYHSPCYAFYHFDYLARAMRWG